MGYENDVLSDGALMTCCKLSYNQRLMVYLLLTITYVVSGKLGLILALPPGFASPIFPPAGIAVAAALIGGKKTLPWIFLGSLLLNIWVSYSATDQIDATGLAADSGIAVASMLQAAIGGWLIQRVIGYPTSLDQSSSILYFILLAPIICLTSASLSVSTLMALGIVDTADVVPNWAAWWIGDTLGVLVMLPLGLIVAGEPRALWRSRVRSVATPILLIFTLFVVIFIKANQWEYDDSLSEFRQLSIQTVNKVQTRLEEQEFLLIQIAGLFNLNVNSQIGRDEFRRFVEKTLVRFPMIQAVEWAPYVDAAHRTSFEAAQRDDFPSFEIRERNAATQLQRAGERTSFCPVTYIEPIAGNEPALGFDLASNPDRLATLIKALELGIAVTTPAVQLVQERQTQLGMLMVFAVKPGDKESGVVLTVLRIGDFMDNLLSDTRSLLYTRLIDLDNQKTLYDSFSSKNQNTLYERTFIFGTRHYRLETAPTPAYIMQHRSWQSWGVLAAGVLGTSLIGALLLLGTGYSARVKAEVDERTRELSEIKIHLQEAQRIAHLGGWELNLDTKRMLWTDEVFRIFEIDPASFNPSFEVFINTTHPEDRSLLDMAYIKSITNREPYSIEYRLLFPDGRIKYLHGRGETVYDSEGRAMRSTGTVQDITERKQAEQTLQRESEKNLALLRNASDGIHILDMGGNVIEASDSFCTMLGYTREEIIGMNVTQWDAKFTPSEILNIIKQQVERPVRSQFETCHRRKDRTFFDVEVSGYPLELDGKPVLFNSSRDITERKLLETSLKSINETLEKRVKEEVAKNMEQERLLVQQSRLAAMGEMIGNIAHQWRQPINALTLLLTNISEAYEYNELDQGYLDKQVNTGQELIQKMSGTIDDFRNFFKPNKEKEYFLVADEIEEAIKLASHSFKNNNIHLTLEGIDEQHIAYGYPNEFAQVVLNALSNAKEAILGLKIAGLIQIKLETIETATTVTIRNNGGRIPNEILGKVFEPYFTTKEKGTGIGLYMSKMIMEHMGGIIAIGNVDNGVEVLLTLPLTEFAPEIRMLG